MTTSSFIVRAPLIDPQQNVLGYHIRRTGRDTGAFLTTDCVSRLHVETDESLARVPSYILDLDPALDEMPYTLPPEHTVLAVQSDALNEPQALKAATAWRNDGYGLYVRHAETLNERDPAISLASHIEIGYDATQLPHLSGKVAQRVSPVTRIVVRDVVDWDRFAVCAGLDDDVAMLACGLASEKRPLDEGAQLSARQLLILELMEMARQNVDMALIEAGLKKEPALVYMLLRFMGSPQFRRDKPITTLRQAITVLGYKTLYRWLSVLLTQTGGSHSSPFLVQAALARGRFCELLGSNLSGSDTENLFTVGMLSTFELILGIPVAKVLKELSMPAEVTDAVLHQEGPYGAYLAVALACEKDGEDAGTPAARLNLDPKAVNLAHLDAIAWTQSIDV